MPEFLSSEEWAQSHHETHANRHQTTIKSMVPQVSFFFQLLHEIMNADGFVMPEQKFKIAFEFLNRSNRV